MFGVSGSVGHLDLGDASQLGGSLGGSGAVAAGDQHFDVGAELCGGTDGVEGGGLQAGVVVFGDDEDGHFCFVVGANLFAHGLINRLRANKFAPTGSAPWLRS